jgi:hypothetical protein
MVQSLQLFTMAKEDVLDHVFESGEIHKEFIEILLLK